MADEVDAPPLDSYEGKEDDAAVDHGFSPDRAEGGSNRKKGRKKKGGSTPRGKADGAGGEHVYAFCDAL